MAVNELVKVVGVVYYKVSYHWTGGTEKMTKCPNHNSRPPG